MSVVLPVGVGFLSFVVCQDVAVPFMTNLCWEDDTMFMVFEEDFRFEPENEDDEPQMVPAAAFQEVVGVPGGGPQPGEGAVPGQLRESWP